jgi:hypothetical protein
VTNSSFPSLRTPREIPASCNLECKLSVCVSCIFVTLASVDAYRTSTPTLPHPPTPRHIRSLAPTGLPENSWYSAAPP